MILAAYTDEHLICPEIVGIYLYNIICYFRYAVKDIEQGGRVESRTFELDHLAPASDHRTEPRRIPSTAAWLIIHTADIPCPEPQKRHSFNPECGYSDFARLAVRDMVPVSVKKFDDNEIYRDMAAAMTMAFGKGRLHLRRGIRRIQFKFRPYLVYTPAERTQSECIRIPQCLPYADSLPERTATVVYAVLTGISDKLHKEGWYDHTAVRPDPAYCVPLQFRNPVADPHYAHSHLPLHARSQ